MNAETGEMFDALTTEQAERLTTRISLKLDAMADTYAGVMPLIREVIVGQAHIALGYRSFSEYVADRFGGSLGKLGVEMRREVVRELTDAGMSTRAIAPVLGISNKTVSVDRRVTEVTPETPEHGVTDAAEAADPGITAPRVPRAPVTGIDGIDGKTYTPPVRRQEQNQDAEVLLNLIASLTDKAARQAEKLTPAQIARVKPKADLWTVGLGESLETLQGLLTSLTEEK